MEYNYIERKWPYPVLTSDLKSDHSPKANAKRSVVVTDEESLLDIGRKGFLVGTAKEDYERICNGESIESVFGEEPPAICAENP